jgi:3-dehydroquinate synthase
MVVAAKLSEMINGFDKTDRLVSLLMRYDLPVSADADYDSIFSVLKMDKKRDAAEMNYVLLNGIGDAVVKKIAIDELEKMILKCK